MLAEAANGKFNVVVVLDLSRFGRSLEDRIRIRNMLVKDFGVRLHSLKGGIFNDSPTGRLQDNIMAGVVEWQRDVIVARSASALRHKFADLGERNIGHLFYGLTWAPDKKSAVHDPTEYPLVRLVVELRLRLRWSYVVIVDFLNGKFRDKRGQAKADKLNVQIPSTYRGNVLWDRFKVGYICSLNIQKYCSGKSSIKFDGQEFHYKFPPLISTSELTQLKKVLPDYIQGKPRKHYLLTSKIVCGLCGSRLYHNIVRNKKYKGRPREYRYYMCVHKMYANNGSRCTLPSIRQEWLDKEVWDQLAHLFSSQSHFEAVLFQADTKLEEDKRYFI